MSALLQPAGLLSDEIGLHIEVLTVLLLKKYGPTFIEWEPETLYEQLEEDFGPVGVVTVDRIGAAQVLSAHNGAWREWEIFENVVAAAQGLPSVFSQSQPPEAEFAAVGLNVLAAFGENEFHVDVIGYIAAACINDGTWYVEPPLDIVKEPLADFYRKQGFQPDVAALERLLKAKTEYIQEPTTAVETQFNHVLSVRKATAEHKRQVEDQLRRIQ